MGAEGPEKTILEKPQRMFSYVFGFFCLSIVHINGKTSTGVREGPGRNR